MAHHELVDEVLAELLLDFSGFDESVQVCCHEVRHEVASRG